MKNDVSKLTDAQRAALFPITIEKHNLNWKIWYEKEKQSILKNVEDIKVIHHYGSTSIPSIAAKPIVDILIEVEKDTDLSRLKQSFLDLGYNYMNFGKPPSMMFVKGYTVNGFAEKVFHVHVHYEGLQEDLVFRDYLIAHPDTAAEYESLKLSLKEKYEYDRDGYTSAKSGFIMSVIKKALSSKKY